MVGTRIETVKCGWLTIIAELPDRRYLVRFDDGFEKITTSGSISDRKIKNPYARTVFGVGILGEGYRCSIPGTNKRTREYGFWINMMARCYDTENPANSSYLDKTVCEEWHYFQNFAEWCQTQAGFGLDGWTLDKDLLEPGCKVYSPSTCCFLPKSVNSSLAKYSTEGVKKCWLKADGRWQVSYYNLEKGKRTTTTFGSYESACEFYEKTRFNQVKEQLEFCKDQLSTAALSRLESLF